MAGTKRIRIDRSLRQRITPRALGAFRRLVELEAACIGPPGCEPFQRCGACEEWWVQQSVIHRELGLKPWEFAVEHENTGEWPADEGARARWRLFEEADDQKGVRSMHTLGGQRRGRRKREPVKSENPNLGDADLPSPGEPVA